MKKSLMTLAVLAACSSSFAQSTVGVYGVADVFFGTESGTNVPSQTVIDSGSGTGASRYGIKGVDDLGDGWKAVFLLENGFSVDTGAEAEVEATPKQTFSRQSYVGFVGEFGEVRLGRTWTPFDDVSSMAHAAFDSALSPQTHVWASTHYQANPANTIYYAAPNLAGFRSALSYSTTEDEDNVIKGSSSPRAIMSVSVQYADGPLNVGFASQSEKGRNPDVDDMNVTFMRVNATYDFGVAKLLMGYGRTRNASLIPTVAQGALTNVFGFKSDAAVTEWEVGADVPLSSVLTLSGGLAYSTDNEAAGDASRRGYSLAAAYSLSRRTTLYGGFNASTTSFNSENYSSRATAMGVRHAF